MTRKEIDEIVWWIPFKKLRNFIRDYFFSIISINENLDYLNKRIINISSDFSINKFLLNEVLILNSNDKIFLDIIILLQKKDFPSIFSELRDLWFKHYSYNQLSNSFELVERFPNIWSLIDNKFWLIYISILYENHIFDKAESLLKDYYNKFGVLDIHRFLFVSKLAKSLSIENDNINKSLLIANKLDESIENNIFENLIKGKSVAVVGNGPQEIGKGRGKEIDSHDIVIRFNNFNLEGFEEDYGIKTDIWASGVNVDSYYNNIPRNYSTLYCIEAYLYRAILSDFILSNLYFAYKHKNIYCFNIDMHIVVKNVTNVNYLTTGGLLLFYIYFIKKNNNEKFNINNIYGFSFLDNNLSYSNYHYYNDNIPERDVIYSLNNWHSIDNEIIFLRKLFNL